ncbi:ABC transporter permease [Halobellus limi]|uniref:ABC transporter permease n=1 Tax=Halobellus limi TaxID=699433 RepID=A0A1H6BVQ0_9EURY|nr:ABC transporter permease [Halobellus limi]QCC49439.1 ABC transporter permease [Halobellus limi]SEG64768.1 spermidine/putrescine transport system permease protein [Halobellus limi]
MLGAITDFTDDLVGQPNRVSDWLDEYLPAVPPAAYLLIFLILPILYAVYISFFEYSATTIISWNFTLEHYEQLLFDSFYQGLLWYTVRLSIIVSAFCVILGYPLGYFIATTTPLRRQLALFAVFLPLMVGTVVRIYGWIVLFATNGVINTVLQDLLGFKLTLLGNTLSVTIGLIGVYLPLVVLPVYSSIEDIPDSLVPAARNLGANQLQAFYKVTFRLSLPGLLTGTIFVFVLTMNSIVTPDLLGGRTDLTMGLMIYDNAVKSLNWPFASAVGTVLTITTTALVYIYFSFVRDRMGVSEWD